MDKYAIILAAGAGTRMVSDIPKCLHKLCGKAIIEHIIDALDEAKIEEKIIVIGYQREKIIEKYSDDKKIKFVIQEEQLGNAHAVMQASSLLEDKEGITILTYSDTPLIEKDTFEKLLEIHQNRKAAATILTVTTDNPFGYGRIARDNLGNVIKIVEEKDATDEEREIKEINSGFYCFNNKLLFEYVKKINNNNLKNEYYITDIIELLAKDNHLVVTCNLEDTNQGLGVNDRKQLANLTMIMQERINERHLINGVTLIDINHTYIDKDVVIGCDTIIYPNCYLQGNTKIGKGCVIGPDSYLRNVELEDNVKVEYSYLTNTKIDRDARIGPYARLRGPNIIGSDAKIGNFVEIKNSTIGEATRVGHLAYIGDSSIGKDVNIGCGVVTVNYDGQLKHKTIVEDNAFVGCNVNLIAPIKVGKSSYVAAGSTINIDVPSFALAVSRVKDVTIKDGYAIKYKLKQ